MTWGCHYKVEMHAGWESSIATEIILNMTRPMFNHSYIWPCKAQVSKTGTMQTCGFHFPPWRGGVTLMWREHMETHCVAWNTIKIINGQGKMQLSRVLCVSTEQGREQWDRERGCLYVCVCLQVCCMCIPFTQAWSGSVRIFKKRSQL